MLLRRGDALTRFPSSPLPAARPDLPHHLQRRPGAGPANRCRSGAQGRLHPAARRSARSTPPPSSPSIPRSPSSGSPTMARWTRPACSDARSASGSCSGCRRTSERDTVSALVLGVDPLRLQLPDGRISFSPPGRRSIPASWWWRSPRPVLGVAARKAQDQLRLGYFTGGASWQASYQVVLGRAGRAGDRDGGAPIRVAAGRKRRDPAAGRVGEPGAARGVAPGR